MNGKVVKHQIALVFECRRATQSNVASLLNLKLSDVATQLMGREWINPKWTEGTENQSSGSRPIWHWMPMSLSSDLHNAARSILRVMPTEDVGMAPGCLTLTRYGQRVADGRYMHNPSTDRHAPVLGLKLELNKTVLKRVGISTYSSLPFFVEDILFWPFETRVGVVVVHLRIEPPLGESIDIGLITEAVRILADERVSPQIRFLNTASAEAFHIATLVRTLLASSGIIVMGNQRTFTYCNATTSGIESEEDQRDAAFHLSRHYISGFATGIASEGSGFLRSSQNVLHAIGLEGVASLVNLPDSTSESSAESDLLKTWTETTYRPSYLPILLIVFHQYVVQLRLAESVSSSIDFVAFETAEIERLQRLCDRFLAFRLRYRPALLSRITANNQFGQLVADALQLDALSQKVAQDVSEVAVRLTRSAQERIALAEEATRKAEEKQRKVDAERELQQERRWAWHGALISGAVVVLAVLGLTTQIGSIADVAAGVTRANIFSQSVHVYLQLGGFVLAVSLGFVGAYLSWHRLSRGRGEAERIIVAIEDHVVQSSAEKPSPTPRGLPLH